MGESICTYGFIPVREEASETAEMSTQLLFGETYSVLESKEKWLRIRIDFDGYEGWIDAKLHRNIFAAEVQKWRESKRWIAPGPFVKIIREGDRSPMIIPGGSEICFNGQMIGSFVVDGQFYNLASNYNARKPHGTIEEIALSYYSSPYLWGGRSFYGIDCSGFVQVVGKIAGKRLPRNASQQMELGEDVNFVEEVRPGDLAFFGDDERIRHVGLCIGKGEIIHASGSVRIDKLDHNGIYNAELRGYTHRLRRIKRID